jgi:hypothetical protein
VQGRRRVVGAGSRGGIDDSANLVVAARQRLLEAKTPAELARAKEQLNWAIGGLIKAARSYARLPKWRRQTDRPRYH